MFSRQKGMQTKANNMLGTLDTRHTVCQKPDTKKSQFIDAMKIDHSTAADSDWPLPHVCTEVIPLKAAAIEAPSAPLNKGPGLRKSRQLRQGRIRKPTQQDMKDAARCSKYGAARIRLEWGRMGTDGTATNFLEGDAGRIMASCSCNPLRMRV